MPPVDGKARLRRRQRAQRLDSELNDLGVRWWHIVFALPAAAISVFIGRWLAINVQRMKWGTIKGELVSWGVNLFERAPGPVINNDLLIEEKLWMRDDFFEAKLGEGSKCPFERVRVLLAVVVEVLLQGAAAAEAENSVAEMAMLNFYHYCYDCCYYNYLHRQ